MRNFQTSLNKLKRHFLTQKKFEKKCFFVLSKIDFWSKTKIEVD